LITICSGMMRSASTWAFNIARMISQGLYGDVQAQYCNIGDIDAVIANASGPMVIKAHYPSRDAMVGILSGRFRNIYTIRDPRDCYVSRRAFVPTETPAESLSVIMAAKPYAEVFLSFPDRSLIIRYEDVISSPAHVIQSIGEYMGAGISITQAQIMSRNTSPKEVKKFTACFRNMATTATADGHLVEENTQFHSNHITDGRAGRWKTDLLAEDRDFVLTEEMTEFAEMLGYE